MSRVKLSHDLSISWISLTLRCWLSLTIRTTELRGMFFLKVFRIILHVIRSLSKWAWMSEIIVKEYQNNTNIELKWTDWEGFYKLNSSTVIVIARLSLTVLLAVPLGPPLCGQGWVFWWQEGYARIFHWKASQEPSAIFRASHNCLLLSQVPVYGVSSILPLIWFLCEPSLEWALNVKAGLSSASHIT